MPTKKANPKMDQKLVAAREKLENEVKYIAKKYKIPITKVREAMKLAGKNGKPARSRTVIYVQLRLMGFPIPERKKHS